MTNCPNCGAPIHGSSCEYCGTEFDTIRVAPIRPKIYPQELFIEQRFTISVQEATKAFERLSKAFQ